MALISIKRNVDLQPGLNAPAVFNCSQGDKGTTMMLGLMNGGNDYTVPSGITITIRGSRSNGAVFTPTSATFSGSTVSFTLTEEMTDTAGPTLCEAVLEQGNNVLGTANFIINVEGSPMGADVPPVFTDAAWAWMLGKLTTETVPALGDDVISSIQGKVDKNQGSTNAKKFLRVNTSGNVSLASTDKTLLIADQIADAKETGDQIRALDAEIDGVATTLGGSISTLNGITTDLQSSKLNKNQGASNAGKTMVVDSSGNIVPGDVPITIDDTLSIADAAADAKAAGDAIALKANASTIAPEFSDQNTYTAGSYVYKNGVLYRFTADHTGAWTGTDAETVTVGKELTDLKADLSDIESDVNSFLYDEKHFSGWEKGTFAARTGNNYSSDNFIRMTSFVDSVNAMCKTGYIMNIWAYNASGTYAGLYRQSGSFSNSTVTSDVANVSSFDCSLYPDYKFKITMRKDPADSSISANDGNNCYYLQRDPTDETLSISGKPADAKATGNRIEDIYDIVRCFKTGFYTYEDLENDGVIKINSSSVESIVQTGINKTSRFFSLEGVRYIKFSGLYGYYHDTNVDFVGISFVDKAHKHVSAPIEELTNGDHFIDLNDYPGAVFFRFTSANNVTSCKVELYSETLELAKKRNHVYVGAYYFAGWSEWELPNIHFTHSLLHDYSGRKPKWGWFAHGSYRCDAWLYSPEIEIGSGTDVELSLVGSCVFNTDACSINVYSDGAWRKLDNADLGDADNPEIVTNTFDLSAYANKTIKLGFRIFNKNTDISPIWTINGIGITVDNISIFSRNFTNSGVKDFTTNDEETWRVGIPTRAYNDVNGYVGTAYDTADTSIIDKEIILAKEKGIDYFVLNWYYHDNNSTISIPAIEAESNNIAVNAMMNAAQKYGFKYCIMISNHSPFIINGLQNWKDTFAYLDQKYFKDPSYLKYEGRPVVNVFRYNELLDVFDELNDYIKTELGYAEGVIWQICQKNTRYNNGLHTISSSSTPQEIPYSTILSDTQSDIRSYYNAQNYEYYFPCLTVRWDTRPWADRPGSYARNSNYCVTTVAQWREALRWATQWVRGCQTGFKSFLIYAWNEMGEGGYLVPTDGDGEATFLNAINDIINEESEKLIM